MIDNWQLNRAWFQCIKWTRLQYLRAERRAFFFIIFKAHSMDLNFHFYLFFSPFRFGSIIDNSLLCGVSNLQDVFPLQGLMSASYFTPQCTSSEIWACLVERKAIILRYGWKQAEIHRLIVLSAVELVI